MSSSYTVTASQQTGTLIPHPSTAVRRTSSPQRSLPYACIIVLHKRTSSKPSKPPPCATQNSLTYTSPSSQLTVLSTMPPLILPHTEYGLCRTTAPGKSPTPPSRASQLHSYRCHQRCLVLIAFNLASSILVAGTAMLARSASAIAPSWVRLASSWVAIDSLRLTGAPQLHS